ncbi:hypothetical protein GQS52_12225 [Streptomyces sp. SCUT-3]|nr:hypothetical protein GQS52_12225 [Streptomyces sp. SCUT-3]
MQQGMLFHTLLAPDSSSYFEQTILSLEGVTDVEALARAWQTVTDATPVLRSFVVHQGLAEPVQVVLRDVTVPVVTEDWRGLSEDEQRAALREFLARDEAAGIDPTAPPLSRVALARLTDTRVQIVWTFHHLLLDGWSLPLVMADLFTAYRGQPLPTGHPSATTSPGSPDRTPKPPTPTGKTSSTATTPPSPSPTTAPPTTPAPHAPPSGWSGCRRRSSRRRCTTSPGGAGSPSTRWCRGRGRCSSPPTPAAPTSSSAPPPQAAPPTNPTPNTPSASTSTPSPSAPPSTPPPPSPTGSTPSRTNKPKPATTTTSPSPTSTTTPPSPPTPPSSTASSSSRTTPSTKTPPAPTTSPSTTSPPTKPPTTR